ncbi:Mor transcription activator family protein [Dethiosulfatibacter aminovorans DSM 17477]|uniref:Mor transcription activator family protein n=1 Tax=Dethiosulfatibacter aminovorans DSM 17477 TaxID=1121476 RepID=A0A1M6LUB7_9FIRM|nr:Mor transcription activator family protein [Dethiosulfatibacter aminovorans]SHJ74858.1 Mor transcription activator family protein [Dethiosulfatibacter aminovorans DSM 17477]
MDKKINSKDLNGVYKDIADNISMDVAVKFHENFGGLQITFPKHFYSTEYVVNQIKNEFTGNNFRELAKKYNYSERWIRELIRRD